MADIIATEGRAKYNMHVKYGDRDIYKGLTYWAPNVNIFRDPRWGRGHETYGEDPYLTSRLGVRFIQALQGDDPVYMKAAACAKHLLYIPDRKERDIILMLLHPNRICMRLICRHLKPVCRKEK